MSDLVLFCKSCGGAVRPVDHFATECPACGLSPARWTTSRPYPNPRQPFHNSASDAAFLHTLKIDGAD